jgi:hypothetical protein
MLLQLTIKLRREIGKDLGLLLLIAVTTFAAYMTHRQRVSVVAPSVLSTAATP